MDGKKKKRFNSFVQIITPKPFKQINNKQNAKDLLPTICSTKIVFFCLHALSIFLSISLIVKICDFQYKQIMISLKGPSNAIFTLFLLVFFLQVCQFASADLLCRNCGHLVTTAPALKNVMSPRAIEHWNLTVLGVETVVQVFKNSVPETFNLITANGADLKFSGKSYVEDTWFPGMRWTPCVCSSCSSHIGWYFEAQKDDFVGLVLDYLISSEYADTLTKVPFG